MSLLAPDAVDWTDLGTGTGESALLVTAGLPLRKRTAVTLVTPPRLPNWTIIHADIRTWKGRGDVVSLLDVIEHLTAEEGQALLQRLRGQYRRGIVYTPFGFLRQDSTTHPELAEDPLMWHRSGWVPADFADCHGLVWPIYHRTAGGSCGVLLATWGIPMERLHILHRAMRERAIISWARWLWQGRPRFAAQHASS
jgi:hypothetical protein